MRQQVSFRVECFMIEWNARKNTKPGVQMYKSLNKLGFIERVNPDGTIMMSNKGLEWLKGYLHPVLVIDLKPVLREGVHSHPTPSPFVLLNST